MTLQEIKAAVEAGKRVFWRVQAYEVIKDKNRWLIYCHLNSNCSGLTWADGVTMSEKPEDFFIA